jgi:AAA domain/DnaB-like helicase N terminal domain
MPRVPTQRVSRNTNEETAPELLPFDVEAERVVLTTALLLSEDKGEEERELRMEALSAVTAADFYCDPHRRIFATISELRRTNRSVDVVSVGTFLRDHGELASIGGMHFLVDLLARTPHTAIRHVRQHARTVREKSVLRDAIRQGQLASAEARLANGDAATLASGWSQRFASIAEALGAVGAQRKAKVLSIADICGPLPPLSYLVQGLGLVAGPCAPHMITGYGFSGKTMALQSLLLSLAAGRSVWGAYTTGAARRVLHVDLEQGERLTRERYQRLMRGMALEPEDVGDRLGLACYPDLSLRREHYDAWRRLLDGVSVVGVDSFKASIGGIDENSSDARYALDLCGELSHHTGATFLVISHARKPQKDALEGRYSMRGSSALFDACDCVYALSASKGEPISVEQHKARSAGVLLDPFALQIVDVPRGHDLRWGVRVGVFGIEAVTEAREQAETERTAQTQRRCATKVCAFLAAQGECSGRRLREELGLSARTLASAISHLRETGAIVSHEQCGGARGWTEYRLTGSPCGHDAPPVAS